MTGPQQVSNLMKAIEFEATAEHRCIRLPDAIPDGTHMHVLLLMDDSPPPEPKVDELKRVLAGLTEGLTDEDLTRTRDFGRGNREWDI